MTGTSLRNKVAVVTGASRGIGRATALALAAEGATVVVNYLSSAAAADEVAKTIGADRSIAVQADVSTVAGGKKLVDAVVQEYGRIDILVCNAGLLVQNGSLDDTTEENFDKVIGANVKGVFFLVKGAAPHISEQTGRVLLFSTSLTAASTITPNYLLYATSKGAVEQMSRVLAKDLGRKGITVNTIAPGPTGTDAFFEGKNDRIIQTIASWNPMNRIGKPEEIASIVVMAARPEASWMNGMLLRANGGFTVG